MKGEEKMKRIVRKCFMAFLALFITLSFVSTHGIMVNAVEEGGLVDIAKHCDVTVPQNEGAISNMFDGNTQTIWSPSSTAGWPDGSPMPSSPDRPPRKVSVPPHSWRGNRIL